MISAKNYIEFYFDNDMFNKYHQYINNNFLNTCLSLKNAFNIENKQNKILLNISADADILNNRKLEEMQMLCNVFKDKYFYFLSGDFNDAVCFQFPYDIGNLTSDSENSFFSFLLEYNFWLTENWCRWVSGGSRSDIITVNKENVDFSHELIIINDKGFHKVSEIYDKRYGKIVSILEHKNFLKEIFGEEFHYFLYDNVYITDNSIDYLKNQLR